MRKLSRKQWQTLRMDYDSDTVWQIQQNIIDVINKYSKDHNLKGFWKKWFISEIKSAFVGYYALMPKDFHYPTDKSRLLNYYKETFAKYNIMPYDNVMSVKHNILSKFGNAWKERRKEYLRFCTVNSLKPIRYKSWKHALELRGSLSFI